MPVPVPTDKEILERSYNTLKNETSINVSLDSSATGVMLKIISAELSAVWKYIAEQMEQANLTTATGSSLDDLGLLVGAVRKEETKATTSGQVPSIRFTNLSGSTINIPTGTRVFADKDPNIAYFTTEGAVVNSAQTADIHATAAFSGTNYNVGVGDLNRHSLPYTNVTVTNLYAIQNGSYKETDASYRQRILQELRRRNAFTVDNCSSLLRSIDGIKDVLVLNLYRGAGTFDVICVPYIDSQANELVAQCKRILQKSCPIGIDFKVRSPKLRQLDLSINLRFVPDATNKEATRQLAKSIIISRINNLPVENGLNNSVLYLSQLKNSVASIDSSIFDATINGYLDDVPLAVAGEIRLNIGEKITLRNLTIN